SELKKKDENKSELASTLRLIGRTLLELKRVDEAEPYLIEALQLKREAKETAQQGAILNTLGELKIQQRRYTEAESFLNQAEQAIAQAKSLDELRQNLALKVALYSATGEPSRALKFSQQLLEVKDS